MVNNVSKKTFLPKFSNSVFFPETLSLKKLLQQELLATITRSKSLKIEVNNWKQLNNYLSKKTILCPSSNSDFKIAYRCAISFYLSKPSGLSPLLMAEQLSLLLISAKKKTSVISSLNLEVTVSTPGYLDFSLSHLNIRRWLDYLIFSIPNSSIPQLISYSKKNNRQTDFLFPLYYIHKRCCSLLRLGEQEGLISLKTGDSSYLDWARNQPNNFYGLGAQTKIGTTAIAENNLSWQILWLIDLLLENEDYFQKNQNFLVQNTCKVWSQFIAECRFCGAIKKQDQELAKVRLSLIALYCWCLKTLLIRANFDVNDLS